MATTNHDEPDSPPMTRRDRIIRALFWDLYLLAELVLAAWLAVELAKAVHS
jgi:hypothetical protein